MFKYPFYEDQRVALLIIDMINDFKFEYGKALAEKALPMSDSILKLKQQFKQQNLPVIYINDHYNLWQANLPRLLDHCLNKQSEPILKKLAPQEDDYFLIKPKHSAFYNTSLETLLRELDIDTLVLTGIAGNICVLFTANDAYMRGYKLIIPSDCITSNDSRDNEYALLMMKNVLKAHLFSTKDMTESLSDE
ncbi:cysteine hydrolase [Bacillus luteolus]|uniref:Cysteine hydrolase n=1 Tax=Litchfieldia luteola TaxID=682179 RepID=A0ABR9QH28_9BACI|nr:isochorismatase family cysteine hydrolase [Cytobacillus luteolus]MBE4907792.1 cysteine hydrolase [Cytobacillus luteolus]MBP1944615.1 nicotinamidase-related amidase [Cytobacillus luteolus]